MLPPYKFPLHCVNFIDLDKWRTHTKHWMPFICHIAIWKSLPFRLFGMFWPINAAPSLPHYFRSLMMLVQFSEIQYVKCEVKKRKRQRAREQGRWGRRKEMEKKSPNDRMIAYSFLCTMMAQISFWSNFQSYYVHCVRNCVPFQLSIYYGSKNIHRIVYTPAVLCLFSLDEHALSLHSVYKLICRFKMSYYINYSEDALSRYQDEHWTLSIWTWIQSNRDR